MAKQILTSEDKAGAKIADVISDLRLDANLVGESLGVSQPVDVLNRLVEMINGMYVSRERFRKALGYEPSEVSIYPEVDSEETETHDSFSNHCEILADIYENCRDDERFAKIFNFADLGLPLAFLINNGTVVPDAKMESLVEEAWDAVVKHFNLNVDVASLDEILS